MWATPPSPIAGTSVSPGFDFDFAGNLAELRRRIGEDAVPLGPEHFSHGIPPRLRYRGSQPPLVEGLTSAEIEARLLAGLREMPDISDIPTAPEDYPRETE